MAIPCLAATITRSIIKRGIIYQWIVVQTPRTTPMGQKTCMPCQHEVSHGVRYKLLIGVATVPLVRGTVGCPGEVGTTSKHVHGFLS